jgi:hypothetical protein
LLYRGNRSARLTRTGAATLYIEPGSPWENGHCESFNSKLRDEFLNGEILYSLKGAQVLAERWRVYYNTERPHSSLGYRPPAPVAWQIEDPLVHGKVESKQRFPLFHAPDCGGELSNSPSALTNNLAGTNYRAGQVDEACRCSVLARRMGGTASPSHSLRTRHRG